MSAAITTARRPLHRRIGALIVAMTAATLMLVTASPASAHHGWDGFDTERLVYIAGTVTSDGSWGEPHSYFDITLDADLPSDTPDLGIPEDLQGPEDSSRVNAAVAYDGPREGLQIIIAPPAWTGRWGLDRPLETGERFQGVGYVNQTDDGLFRPVVFWYGDDEVPVNQVLGSTLPAHPPLPGSAAATASPLATSPALDPLETPAPSADTETGQTAETQASAAQGGAGTWVVWTAFGLVIITTGVFGSLYLRRRARQS